MNIKLYNTLTRKIEDFIPIDTNCIKIYTCGPTVYHYAHLGNLRAYVFADILQKTLKTKYKNIKHVINITDVGHLVGDSDDGQDKMEKGAARENKNVWEIANFYTEAFLSDIEKLNINKNNFIWTKATDYIKEQIELVRTLTEKGYTYTISDGIYFDTSKFKKYGELAKLDIKNLDAGKRINLGEKKHKTDFALWKFSPKNEKRQMEWIYDGKRAGILITDEIINTLTESENKTRGFPGWHIECSAMSKSVLGEHFDIHTGGIDHIPVHHTNEIAQSECAYDTEKFVNYWCHVNFLNDKTGKMSKSNNHFLRLETLIEKGYNPLAYRYMLLGTSYKTEINFSYEALTGAQNALSKLQKWVELNKDNNAYKDTNTINQEIYNNFLSFIYNDLNTSGGLAIMWDMINNKSPNGYNTLLKMNEILGLDLDYKAKSINLNEETLKIIEELKTKRKQARLAKDWDTADKLRKQIQNYGIEVVD